MLLKTCHTKGVFGKKLFHKEHTTSDVGTLNLLLIPKRVAFEVFPSDSGVIEVELTFWDGWNDEGMEIPVL